MLSIRQFGRYGQVFSLGLFLLIAALPTQAAELQEIRKRGYLIVAVKDNLRPLGFRDPSGQLQGLEIDLAQRLAQALLGKTNAVVLQPVANLERLERVETDQVDLAIARVTVTAARSRLVNFSLPYYLDGTGVIVRDPALKSLNDLAGRRVAVLDGSSTIAGLRFVLPSIQMVGVASYQEAQTLLAVGTVDAFAADASLLSGWVQQAPAYRLLPTRLSTEALAVVLPKGLQYDDLRQAVNAAIAEAQTSGWLPERIHFWGLPTNTPLKIKPSQFDRLEEAQ